MRLMGQPQTSQTKHVLKQPIDFQTAIPMELIMSFQDKPVCAQNYQESHVGPHMKKTFASKTVMCSTRHKWTNGFKTAPCSGQICTCGSHHKANICF